MGPVEFVIELNPEILVLIHYLDVQTLDVYWYNFSNPSTEIDHHLLSC